jgi:hypothetical protein
MGWIEQDGRKIWIPEEKITRRTKLKVKNATILGVLLVTIVSAAVLLAPTLRESPAEAILSQAAALTVEKVNDGSVTAEYVARVSDAARARSGCGWVEILPFPLSQSSQSQTGIGAASGDPSAQVLQGVQKQYRPDILSSKVSDDHTSIVVSMGWAC